MSGFSRIPNSAIAVGRSLSQALLLRVRNNFIAHETRILRFETSSRNFPVGTVLEFAGTVVPSGFLLCDGSAISQSVYSGLFAVLSTTFNTGGEGAGNFRLPDRKGRSVLGAGAGAGLTARTLAQSGGEESHVLTLAELPAHTHAVTDPTHDHNLLVEATAGGAGTAWRAPALNGTPQAPTTTSNAKTTGITVNSTGGSGLSHPNLQPSLVLNYIIKT